MKRHFCATLLLAGILAAPLAAQMPQGYLDVDIAKVKAGKRGDFDTASKKVVEINRKNKGDNWVAYEVVYGVPNTVYFVATRSDYGAIEAATTTFEGVLAKALGPIGMRKLFDDWGSTVESQLTEFRRRRWDLTASAPADPAAYATLIGQSRYLRVATVHVRPGRVLDYEAQLKIAKKSQELANQGVTSFVTQGVAGQATGTFYISTLVKSLSDLDEIKSLQEVLGSQYAGYQRVVAETVLGTDIMVARFLPELSNPPDDIVAVDSKFWRPAPPSPPKPVDAKKQ